MNPRDAADPLCSEDLGQTYCRPDLGQRQVKSHLGRGRRNGKGNSRHFCEQRALSGSLLTGRSAAFWASHARPHVALSNGVVEQQRATQGPAPLHRGFCSSWKKSCIFRPWLESHYFWMGRALFIWKDIYRTEGKIPLLKPSVCICLLTWWGLGTIYTACRLYICPNFKVCGSLEK